MTTFYQLTSYLENLQALISLKENEKLQLSIINDCEIQVGQIEQELIELRQQYTLYNDLLREFMMASVENSCCVSGQCYKKYYL